MRNYLHDIVMMFLFYSNHLLLTLNVYSCHFNSCCDCHDCHYFFFHIIRTPLSSTPEHSALVFKEQEVSTKTSDGLQGDSNDENNF